MFAQAIQEFTSLFQIAGAEALGELSVNLRKHCARFVAAALRIEQVSERRAGAQTEQASVLASGDREVRRLASEAMAAQAPEALSMALPLLGFASAFLRKSKGNLRPGD